MDHQNTQRVRRYIFADEAGCFTFNRNPNVSRYFIVCTVAMNSCEVAHDLLALRRRLIWERAPTRDYFHATSDKQVVRDAVFEVIAKHDFTVQAIILDKPKAQDQVRSSEARFYQYGWYYLFKGALAPYVSEYDELQITAATIGTKKKQGVFSSAVHDVVQQHIDPSQWATMFASSASDPCLQVADYCTWAIQRKWERGCTRSYDLIKHRITHEVDLFRSGRTEYY